MRVSLMVSFCFATLLVGCKEPQPPAAVDGASTAPVASIPEPKYIRSLPERLRQESSSRPTGTPRAEDLIGALKKNGWTLGNEKQVLGSTVGARFCSVVRSEGGVGLSVCEFDSEQAALQGRDFSQRTFDKVIPNRQLLVNRKTLLTVTRSQKTPQVEAEADKAAEIFAGL